MVVGRSKREGKEREGRRDGAQPEKNEKNKIKKKRGPHYLHFVRGKDLHVS